MAHIDKISATARTEKGTRACRKLRERGLVPCNVFGHNQPPAMATMDAEQARSLISSGSKVVDLDVGGQVDKVLVSDVQWDTYSLHLLHIDFLRVDPNERLTVDVPLQLRGIAPGALAGGILEQPHHQVTVECLAAELPDFITVRIGALQLGEAIHARDLTELPAGVRMVTPADVVLVHVVAPKAQVEPTAVEEAPEGEAAAAEEAAPAAT